MKTSEVLKMLEQMHRDKRPPQEIHTATIHYREQAEAKEEADAENAKSKPPINIVGMDDPPPNII